MTLKIVANRDRSSQPRRFRAGGKNHYQVVLSLEGDQTELDQIQSVKYVLHPSFRDPERLSDDKNSNFGTKIWTYGFFPVKAMVKHNDGTETSIDGEVFFE